MAKISVSTYAHLRQYTAGEPTVEIDLPAAGTIGDILQQMGIPAEQTRIVFVNNRAADLEHVVRAGDRVDLFSAIGGG
jgi:sulfur carrier protein ThiS